LNTVTKEKFEGSSKLYNLKKKEFTKTSKEKIRDAAKERFKTTFRH